MCLEGFSKLSVGALVQTDPPRTYLSRLLLTPCDHYTVSMLHRGPTAQIVACQFVTMVCLCGQARYLLMLKL